MIGPRFCGGPNRSNHQDLPSARLGESLHGLSARLLRLGNSQELPDAQVVQLLNRPRRPFDDDCVNMRGLAQAETGPYVILATTVAAAGDIAHLPQNFASDLCFHPDFRANCGPVGVRSDELESNPIVTIAVVPVEEVGLLMGSNGKASVGNEQIKETVVVIISPGAALSLSPIADETAFGDFSESAVAVVVVKSVVFSGATGSVRRTAVHEQIQPAIVVVITPHTPSPMDAIRDRAMGELCKG